jgi:hypothetical protein
VINPLGKKLQKPSSHDRNADEANAKKLNKNRNKNSNNNNNQKKT